MTLWPQILTIRNRRYCYFTQRKCVYFPSYYLANILLCFLNSQINLYFYTNTSAFSLALRICSITKACPKRRQHTAWCRARFGSTNTFRSKGEPQCPQNTFLWMVSLKCKSQSQKPLSLPSRLSKCHCCTPQNAATFGKYPNWDFSVLTSHHRAITFATQRQTGKNAYKSGRMLEGCGYVVSPFCLRPASLLPPFCLRCGND